MQPRGHGLIAHLPSYVQVIILESKFLNNVFVRIVSAHEYFPPLNSFSTFMYCNKTSQYIRPNSKKNCTCGNYSRKYGIFFLVWVKIDFLSKL